MTEKELIALGQKMDKAIIGSITWIECLHILEREENRIFICKECGRKCTYIDLESWYCNFPDHCICSECYENAMGDDL